MNAIIEIDINACYNHCATEFRNISSAFRKNFYQTNRFSQLWPRNISSLYPKKCFSFFHLWNILPVKINYEFFAMWYLDMCLFCLYTDLTGQEHYIFTLRLVPAFFSCMLVPTVYEVSIYKNLTSILLCPEKQIFVFHSFFYWLFPSALWY